MRRLIALLSAGFIACMSPLMFTGSADAASTHALIAGSGSSWAANAVNQWITDVTPNGLQVVFTAQGSAQGRIDFRNATTDYAVSDIGFQGTDEATGDSDTSCTDPNNPSTCRAYAYLPIVAGGTSFPYQIKVGNNLVRNLRLSGETLAKIFTNTLGTPGTATYMNWDNPEITADNNGRKLPPLRIIPVVHSEGSGSTAQFTRYLDTEYPSIWRAFNGAAGLTEYYPTGKSQVKENGSDGVMNFVSSAAANGAIGYDEYSYALGKNYPVVSLENKAGYFTAPTQYNVAVALTKAQINMDKSSPDYLLQNLNGVYTMPDKRAYAMSSYSYMIIPTGANDSRMTTAKRQTLADFLFHDICAGQAEMGPIGYSPLPVNLVQASFQQTNKLKAADSNVSLDNENVTTCHNPTFVAGHPKENHLAEVAPQPPLCDKVGQGPCEDGGVTSNQNPPKDGKGPKDNPTDSPTPGAGGSGGNGGGGGSGGAGPGGGTTPTTVPTDGSVQTDQYGNPVAPQVAGGSPVATSVTLPGTNNGGVGGVLAALAAVELLAVLAIPPVVARRIQRRKAHQ